MGQMFLNYFLKCIMHLCMEYSTFSPWFTLSQNYFPGFAQVSLMPIIKTSVGLLKGSRINGCPGRQVEASLWPQAWSILGSLV